MDKTKKPMKCKNNSCKYKTEIVRQKTETLNQHCELHKIFIIDQLKPQFKERKSACIQIVIPVMWFANRFVVTNAVYNKNEKNIFYILLPYFSLNCFLVWVLQVLSIYKCDYSMCFKCRVH